MKDKALAELQVTTDDCAVIRKEINEVMYKAMKERFEVQSLLTSTGRY